MDVQTDLQLVLNCYYNRHPCLLSGRDINHIFGPYGYETTFEDPESKTMKIDFNSMHDALVCYHNLRDIYNENNVLQLNFTLTGIFGEIFGDQLFIFFSKPNKFSFQSRFNEKKSKYSCCSEI